MRMNESVIVNDNKEVTHVSIGLMEKELKRYKKVVEAVEKYQQGHYNNCDVFVFYPDPVKCSCGWEALQEALKELEEGAENE